MGRPKRVKNPGEKLYTHHRRKVPKRIRSAGIARCTLQSATLAHRTRWVKIENFDQERVFRFDLCVNGLPPGFFTHFGRPTAENYESVFLSVVRPNPGFGPFEVRPWVQFSNFDLKRLQTFTPMVPKVSLQDFLPILGAPRPKIDKIWKLDPFGRTWVQKTESKFLGVGGQTE